MNAWKPQMDGLFPELNGVRAHEPPGSGIDRSPTAISNTGQRPTTTSI